MHNPHRPVIVEDANAQIAARVFAKAVPAFPGAAVEDANTQIAARVFAKAVGGSPGPAGAAGANTIVVEEVDGSPSSAVTKLVLPNGTLTIVAGVATYTPSASTAGQNFKAYSSLTGSAMSSGAFSLYPFNVVQWDTATGYTPGSYSYTIPTTGKWRFDFSVYVTPGTLTGALASVFVNGVRSMDGSFATTVPGGGGNVSGGGGELNLTAGDVITVSVFSNAGTSFSAGGVESSFWCGRFVGG